MNIFVLLPLLLHVIEISALFTPTTPPFYPLYPLKSTNPLSSFSLRSTNPSNYNVPPVENGATVTPNPAYNRKKQLRTFSRYLEVESWRGGTESRNLETVLASVGKACQQISRLIARAATDDIYGVATNPDGTPLEDNVQGEVQQKLDVVCNKIMMNAFCGCSNDVAAIASEEEDAPRLCSDLLQTNSISIGDYVAVFDPLDGSKNIDSSLPVGTIFGIYKYKTHGPAGVTTFLQKGDNLVAAGYCLYSATTILVLTLGGGRVDGFTLDPDRGEFLQTHPDMRIPTSGPLVCFNEANYREFEAPVRRYLSNVKSDGVEDLTRKSIVEPEGGLKPRKFKVSCRYVGAMVADVHNVLVQGGIYGYPKTKNNPSGKLRLLYESNPMGMIIEQAGGAASTGHGRILEVVPTEIHQRVPTYCGSVENIFELEQFFKYYRDED